MKSLLKGIVVLATLALVGCATSPARERVLVSGATGKTGRLVVTELLARGYPVRALARDAQAARRVLPAEVEVVAGNLRDRESLTLAMRGVRRVISAAGAGTLDENDPNGPRAVDFEGTRNLVEAARAERVAQFVLISSQNVTAPDRYGFVAMRPLLRWKFQGEQALRTSGLRYTIVRPGQLLDGPGGEQLRFAQGDALKGPIDRADLARVCVAALGRDAALERTFEIVSSKTPGENDWTALFGALAADR